MDVRSEVRRLAHRAEQLYAAAEDGLRQAIQGQDVYTPFLLEQVVDTQHYFGLWERTRVYVVEGIEIKLIVGSNRLPDTDDPTTALCNLLDNVPEPSPYREGEAWPMDRAFHALEKRAYRDWRHHCSELLANVQQAPETTA